MARWFRGVLLSDCGNPGWEFMVIADSIMEAVELLKERETPQRHLSSVWIGHTLVWEWTIPAWLGVLVVLEDVPATSSPIA